MPWLSILSGAGDHSGTFSMGVIRSHFICTSLYARQILYASVRTVNSLKQDQSLMLLYVLHGASIVLGGPQGPGRLCCDGVHAGILLTWGRKVCFVALDKNRISVFLVTHYRKTRVLFVYCKDKYSSLTHTHAYIYMGTRFERDHFLPLAVHNDLLLFLTPLYF